MGAKRRRRPARDKGSRETPRPPDTPGSPDTPLPPDSSGQSRPPETSRPSGAHHTPGRPRTPVWARALVALMLAAFVGQAMVAARRDSVTIDEFVHLPLGLYQLYTRDFGHDPINPPLSRMIAAAGLLRKPPAFAPEPGMSHWPMSKSSAKMKIDN